MHPDSHILRSESREIARTYVLRADKQYPEIRVLEDEVRLYGFTIYGCIGVEELRPITVGHIANLVYTRAKVRALGDQS